MARTPARFCDFTLTAALAFAGMAVSAPALAESRLTSGTVTVPPGYNITDVKVTMCRGSDEPRCDAVATTRPDHNLGIFSVNVPDSDALYVAQGWIDVDRDGKLSDGDLFGRSNDGRPVALGGVSIGSRFRMTLSRYSAPREPLAGGGATISGSVTGPAGADMQGLIAFACPEPFNNCDRDSITAPVTMNGDRGSYTLRNLRPGRRYQVMVWKDNDRNNDASNGDLLRAANDGQPILPGSGPQDVRVGVFHDGQIYGRLEAVPGGAGKAASSPPSSSQSAGRDYAGGSGRGGGSGGALAGSWSQSSSSSELVLTPKVKVQPTIAATGFSLGTMGTGASSVTTTIQNEYSSVPVQRRMNLDVRPDGSFVWRIEKSRSGSSQRSCMITTREEKVGTVDASGGRVTFNITGGTSSSNDGCSGKSSSSDKRPSSESYDYSVAGSTLRISGSGGVNWVFNRR